MFKSRRKNWLFSTFGFYIKLYECIQILKSIGLRPGQDIRKCMFSIKKIRFYVMGYFALFRRVLEALGSFGRLVGIIFACPDNSPMAWWRVMAKSPTNGLKIDSTGLRFSYMFGTRCKNLVCVRPQIRILSQISRMYSSSEVYRSAFRSKHQESVIFRCV